MDVLNTTGGDFHIFAFVFGIFACLFGVGLAIAAGVEKNKSGGEFMALTFGIIYLIGGLLLVILSKEPIRHEVTLRPGHVIDATKYEVVEQRGKIYVIEEREAGE